MFAFYTICDECGKPVPRHDQSIIMSARPSKFNRMVFCPKCFKNVNKTYIDKKIQQLTNLNKLK